MIKSARKNATKERTMAVSLKTALLDRMLIDGRRGLKAGTVRQICDQFGAKIKVDGAVATISAPRNRLQMVVEQLHFCSVPYSVVA
jgi:hypothetical protein